MQQKEALQLDREREGSSKNQSFCVTAAKKTDGKPSVSHLLALTYSYLVSYVGYNSQCCVHSQGIYFRLGGLRLPSSSSYYITATLANLLPAVCCLSITARLRQEILFCLTALLDGANRTVYLQDDTKIVITEVRNSGSNYCLLQCCRHKLYDQSLISSSIAL